MAAIWVGIARQAAWAVRDCASTGFEGQVDMTLSTGGRAFKRSSYPTGKFVIAGYARAAAGSLVNSMLEALAGPDSPIFSSDRAPAVGGGTGGYGASRDEAVPVNDDLGFEVATAPPDGGTERFVVVVLEVEDQSSQLLAHKRQQITDYLAASAARALGWRVVPPEQVRAALVAEKVGSYDTCFDQACQIELGKALAAEKTLTTKVSRLGSQCIVSATLFDLKTETAERAATSKVPCTEDGFVRAVDDIVLQLPGR